MLDIPRVRTNLGSNAFAYYAPFKWNGLTTTI